MFKIGQSTEPESECAVTRGWGRRRMGTTGFGISFRLNETFYHLEPALPSLLQIPTNQPTN